MLFYLGTHVLSYCKHFEYVFISIKVLRRRKSDFGVNNWIMDSGAFSDIVLNGRFSNSPQEYAQEINRWSNCGKLEMAVSQDYMCEPFALEKTGLTIVEHQGLTIKRYDELIKYTSIPIMPVLQGYEPIDYLRHIEQYGDRLKAGMRVGIGSVCKRNKTVREIVDVIEPIKKKVPDIRLHGFGLKITALKNMYVHSLLYSSDSSAWSYHARKQFNSPNRLSEAFWYINKLNSSKNTKPHQFSFGNEVGDIEL